MRIKGKAADFAQVKFNLFGHLDTNGDKTITPTMKRCPRSGWRGSQTVTSTGQGSSALGEIFLQVLDWRRARPVEISKPAVAEWLEQKKDKQLQPHRTIMVFEQ